MAVITRNPGNTHIVEAGARGIKEALLAGPASGSNKFTVRKIVIEPDGCTARTSFKSATVYIVFQGRVTMSHQDGELDVLSNGDTVVVHPDEMHHMHNMGMLKTTVLKIASQ
jgi:mannose-6-phosphate isomerase-like protein (cupin superfamily)